MVDDVVVTRPFKDGLSPGLEMLREVRCWHLWIEETRTRRDGTPKATKVPYRLDGHTKRQSNGDKGLGAYSEAQAALGRLLRVVKRGTRCGLGISIAHAPVVAMDFDACFPEGGGQIAAWAQPWFDAVSAAGAYTEVSPSGRGLRVIGMAPLSETPAAKRTWRPLAVGPVGDKVAQIEVSNGGNGYVTLTGIGAAGDARANISDLVDTLMRDALEQTHNRVRALGATGNGEALVTTQPCLLTVARLKALLEALSCVPEVVGDHEQAVAMYARFAFVLGSAWPEGREVLRDWALQYDGDAVWIDDLFARIDERGVKVSHAKPFTEWLDTLAASSVLEENAKAVVRDVCLGVVAARPAVALLDGDGLEQVPADEVGDVPRDAAGERMQANAAASLAGELRDRLRWIEERGRWAIREGGRWRVAHEHDVYGLVMPLVRGIAAAQDTAARREKVLGGQWIDTVVRMMRRNTRIAEPFVRWDADPWLMMTPGGFVIDLRNGSRRPATPEDLMLRATGADPVTMSEWRERGPRLARFLAEVFEDADTRRYAQKLFGLALIGKVIEHRLFVFTGDGGNGKSTLLEALMHAMGDYAASVSSKLILNSGANEHASIIANLKGLRLAVMSEVGEDSKFSVERVKKLTGGDVQDARFMRQDWFTFVPSHTLVLLANRVPSFAGDGGMERRLAVIEMLRKPERVDTGLGDMLRVEAPAVLAWAVEGAVLYGAEGLEMPGEVAAASADLSAGADPVSAWFRQAVVVTGEQGDEASSADMVEALREWSMQDRAERGLGTATDAALARRVKAVVMADRRVVVSKNLGRGAGPEVAGRRGYKGLRLVSTESSLE